MLRRGRITLRQLVDAGKAMLPGKRLGTILVEQGVLAPKDLVASWSSTPRRSSTAPSS